MLLCLNLHWNVLNDKRYDPFFLAYLFAQSGKGENCEEVIREYWHFTEQLDMNRENYATFAARANYMVNCRDPYSLYKGWGSRWIGENGEFHFNPISKSFIEHFVKDWESGYVTWADFKMLMYLHHYSAFAPFILTDIESMLQCTGLDSRMGVKESVYGLLNLALCGYIDCDVKDLVENESLSNVKCFVHESYYIESMLKYHCKEVRKKWGKVRGELAAYNDDPVTEDKDFNDVCRYIYENSTMNLDEVQEMVSKLITFN